MGEELESNKSSEMQASEQEQVKHYKRKLENWREVLLHMNSLLLWEKPYYPGIISAYITFIYIILWYFDPSILTTFSIIGTIACVLDFAVPFLSSSVFDSNKWTGVQERKFEEICQTLVQTKQSVKSTWHCVISFKEEKPKTYFLGVVGALIFIAWIGNLVDNLFLAYLVTLSMILLPGIKHHGIMQHYIAQATQKIKDLIAQKKKKN